MDLRPKEPEAFEFSASMPAMSAQDLYVYPKKKKRKKERGHWFAWWRLFKDTEINEHI